MRKDKLIIAGIFAYSLLIAGVVHKYHLTVSELREANTKQQLQVEALRVNGQQWEERYNALNVTLGNTQEKLSLVSNQLKGLAQKDKWYMEEGIATAYSPFDNQSGIEADATGDTTSIGLRPGPGIIAVDPSRIPYNSEILVIFADGSTYKGIAGDTGGALQASNKLHIDIYRDTFSQAEQFGVKNVRVLWKIKATK